MDMVKELERLEDLFYGEWEENKDSLVKELLALHLEFGADNDTFNRFLVQTGSRFGGTYIPYLFWDKLAYYFDVPEERTYLFNLLQVFTESNFEDEEQKKMKPLLVTYFAKEKPFELNKIRAMIIEKAHPQVKEYFLKLLSFVEKNQKATNMYCEKFMMIKDIHPNFELLGLPITQLREKVGS